MPALLFDAEKARHSQTRQMTARSLRRDARDPCQLGRRQRTPIHQGVQHPGTGGIAGECSDFCKGGQAGHCSHPCWAVTFYIAIELIASAVTVTFSHHCCAHSPYAKAMAVDCDNGTNLADAQQDAPAAF